MIRTRRATSHEVHVLRDPSDVAAVRRSAGAAAMNLGASQHDAERVRLVVTELGTNVLRHGGVDGYLLVRSIDDENERGIELIAVDRSSNASRRGVEAIDLDGLGIGLEVVGRQSEYLDTYVSQGGATVTLARMSFVSHDGSSPTRHGCSGVSTALIPGMPNGDGWIVSDRGSTRCALIFDGLGHGPRAAEATEVACSSYLSSYRGDMSEWLSEVHDALRGTRGGVLGLVEIDARAGRLLFLGVGNISGKVLTEGSEGSARYTKGIVSQGGVVGTEYRLPTLRPIEYEWSQGACLLLWTDGIASRIGFDGHPHLIGHDSAVVAAALHRDYAKTTDDSTLVVIQEL